MDRLSQRSSYRAYSSIPFAGSTWAAIASLCPAIAAALFQVVDTLACQVVLATSSYPAAAGRHQVAIGKVVAA